MENTQILTDLDLDVYNAVSKLSGDDKDESTLMYFSLNTEAKASKIFYGTGFSLSLCLSNALKDDEHLREVVTFALVSSCGYSNNIDVPSSLKKVKEILNGKS